MMQRFKKFWKRPSSLFWLNTIQGTAALNENVCRMTCIFFLIKLFGHNKINYVVSLTGFLFVLPQLLFSFPLGKIVDHTSKSRCIVMMKFFELLLMGFVAVALYIRSKIFVYIGLFLISLQIAAFSPARMGILAEIVSKQHMGRAQSILTSTSYFCIITGTFFASILSDLTKENFVLIGILCTIFSALTFFFTHFLPYTPPQNTQAKPKKFSIKELIHLIHQCQQQHHLLPLAIISSTFLFGFGSFIQLNLLPFTIKNLHMHPEFSGYLFFITSLGIIFGASLFGKFSKRNTYLDKAALAGLMIPFLSVSLTFYGENVYFCAAILFLLGCFGGLFSVPFETFMQIYNPEKQRGLIMGFVSFLCYTELLIASGLIILFNEQLDLSPKTGFSIVGFFILFFMIYVFQKTKKSRLK